MVQDVRTDLATAVRLLNDFHTHMCHEHPDCHFLKSDREIEGDSGVDVEDFLRAHGVEPHSHDAQNETDRWNEDDSENESFDDFSAHHHLAMEQRIARLEAQVRALGHEPAP